jgi:hypothetical protein
MVLRARHASHGAASSHVTIRTRNPSGFPRRPDCHARQSGLFCFHGFNDSVASQERATATSNKGSQPCYSPNLPSERNDDNAPRPNCGKNSCARPRLSCRASCAIGRRSLDTIREAGCGDRGYSAAASNLFSRRPPRAQMVLPGRAWGELILHGKDCSAIYSPPLRIRRRSGVLTTLR